MGETHTQGPWHVFDGLVIAANQHGSVAFAYGPSMPEKSQVGRVALANARLIAAAPNLLAALQALLDMDVSYQRGPAVQIAEQNARNAIAKATGEQL